MAGIFGFFQNDLKRVIAFSTCSQLGYMLTSVGLSEFGAEAAISHLMTHASFKAALFLAAGVIIMGSGNTQQVARYGSLTAAHCSLMCYVVMVIASISLMGLPETSGFYSKELIINLSFIAFNPIADFAHTLLLIATLFTATYSFKLVLQCFLYDFSGSNYTVNPASTNKNTLISIAFLILICDILLKIWVGNNLFSGILFFVPWGVKTLPLGLVIAGFLTATAAVYSTTFWIVRFCGTKWGFDQIYSRTLVVIILDWSRITWTAGDKGFFLINNQKVKS